MMDHLTAECFFNLSDFEYEGIFLSDQPAWHVLTPKYKEDWILSNIQPNVDQIETQDGLVTRYQKISVPRGTFEVFPGVFIKDTNIEIGPGCVIESGAYIAGPTMIGEGTVVRQGAYIRGGVLTGKNCVIGHTTEVKSAIFLNGAKAGHFAYIGDSVLGHGVNLGAGTKISNLKINDKPIIIRHAGQAMETGLRKFGAIIGDDVQTGCNSVLNPGTLLGKACMIYPCASIKGTFHKSKSILR